MVDDHAGELSVAALEQHDGAEYDLHPPALVDAIEPAVGSGGHYSSA